MGELGQPNFQSAAVEVHGDLESLRVSIAADALLDRGDFRVQSFSPSGDGVGDAVLVRHHVGQLPRDQLGRLRDRRQLAVCRPEVPAPLEPLGQSRPRESEYGLMWNGCSDGRG